MRLNPEVFLLGLEYPMQTWGRFDHRSFEQVASAASNAGIQAMRLRLPWEEFQPDGDRCSDRCLRDLEAVMNTCGALHIGLMPAVFSSLDSAPGLPSWVSQKPETIVEAQLRLLETLSGYFRAHRALLAWELDVQGVLTPAVGSTWQADLLPALRTWDDRHGVALGLGEDRLFGDVSSIQGVISSLDLAVLRVSGGVDSVAAIGSVAVSFFRKPVFLVTGMMPGSGTPGLERFAALTAAGISGIFVAVPESGNQPDAHGWGQLKLVAAAGWRVGVPGQTMQEPGTGPSNGR